jgi:hypothetical protein
MAERYNYSKFFVFESQEIPIALKILENRGEPNPAILLLRGAISRALRYRCEIPPVFIKYSEELRESLHNPLIMMVWYEEGEASEIKAANELAGRLNAKSQNYQKED